MVEDPKDLKNSPSSRRPLALVTGASDGIGYELAKVFAENGYDLVIAAEDPGIVEAKQAFAQLGGEVEAIQVNLAQYEGVEELYRQIVNLRRPLAAAALNAGVGVGGDFTKGTRLEDELNLINLNVVSTVHLAKKIARDMVDRAQGRILFTSSIAATMPAPFEAVYGASKAFVQSFAQALRNELKGTGVSVTSLMPGATETNFFHRAGMDDTKVGTDEKDAPADVAREGFKALLAGKDHVVAGSLKNRFYAAKIIPETVKAAMHRRLSEPGSAEK